MGKISTKWAAECCVRFMQALRSKVEAMVDPENPDDATLVRDTIEGAADVDGAMNLLIDLRNDKLASAEARKARAKVYTEAAKADEAAAAQIEDLIYQCILASDAPDQKWSGLAGTAYLRQGSWSTEIVNPMAIPLEYQKAVPDVKRIGEALKAGEKVAGAQYVQGDPCVVILKPRGRKEAA